MSVLEHQFSGITLNEILVDLPQFVGRDAHGAQLSQEIVHFPVHELTASLLDDDVIGIGGNKVAQSALGVDDAHLLEVVVGSSHGVGIDFDQCGELAHAGHFSVGGEPSCQNVVADSVGDLQIDGFIIFKVHGGSLFDEGDSGRGSSCRSNNYTCDNHDKSFYLKIPCETTSLRRNTTQASTQ